MSRHTIRFDALQDEILDELAKSQRDTISGVIQRLVNEAKSKTSVKLDDVEKLASRIKVLESARENLTLMNEKLVSAHEILVQQVAQKMLEIGNQKTDSSSTSTQDVDRLSKNIDQLCSDHKVTRDYVESEFRKRATGQNVSFGQRQLDVEQAKKFGFEL